jgi:hypothetical protein
VLKPVSASVLTGTANDLSVRLESTKAESRLVKMALKQEQEAEVLREASPKRHQGTAALEVSAGKKSRVVLSAEAKEE